MKTNVLVIGAGPTGLSAAYHLGSEALLVEANNSVGGWCRSFVDHGFTFDYAGHILFSNDPYIQQMYGKLLGDNIHWQDREAWIYSKGVYTRYPFQSALYGLPHDVIKECLLGAMQARLDKGEPRNFEEFIHKVWGEGIAKHFAIPYNRKIWAVPLDEMETSWLGGRVPLPDLGEIIDGALSPKPKPVGPNARFGYPLRGGFQALTDGFLPLLRGPLLLNRRVTAINGHTALLSDGAQVNFQKLVSTMPLPQLVQACDGVPDCVREAAAGLRHTSVRCVNIGVGRANLTDKHWVYYPEDTIFHRVFMQGNASPHCNPEGGFGLTCEITYGPSKPLPEAGLVERCLADCRRVGLIDAADPIVTTNVVTMPYAYVVYDHHRRENVRTVREWLQKRDIYLAGRYSEWEYYNSDHAILAGKRVAEELQRH